MWLTLWPILLSGVGLYIFREYIRENVADEVSSVATKSLGDQNVKIKAQELAVALLHAILEDANIQQQTGSLSLQLICLVISKESHFSKHVEPCRGSLNLGHVQFPMTQPCSVMIQNNTAINIINQLFLWAHEDIKSWWIQCNILPNSLSVHLAVEFVS